MILVQPLTAKMGPYTFDLSPQLAEGDSITSVEVFAYSKEGVDTTDELISGTPNVTEDVAYVFFKYPGAAYHGSYKLTLKYATINGLTDEADFWRVLVADV